MRKSPWVLVVFILVGGLLGGVMGEILHVIAPHGTIQQIFATSITPGLHPPLTMDLVLVKFTIGFLFKMNVLSFIGILLGIYLYKQV
ncbi:MAG: DUF4321 domain-containing protein [Nitrospiraceae bacterium]